MTAKTALVLKKYQFTYVNVQPIMDHDLAGDRNGTISKCHTKYTYEPETNLVIAEVTISTDIEKSVNPPYMYEMTAFGVFAPTEKGAETSKSAIQQSAQLLIGVIRQQIMAITSTMPWGSFYQGFVIVDTEQDNNG